ncbi:transposase [bacterium]|nr:transposase [bacterium]
MRNRRRPGSHQPGWPPYATTPHPASQRLQELNRACLDRRDSRVGPASDSASPSEPHLRRVGGRERANGNVTDRAWYERLSKESDLYKVWPAPRRVVRAGRESSGRRLARERTLPKKSWFGVEQIVGVLKDADTGVRAGEPCRKYGTGDQTYYRWKAKYGGMEAGDAVRLRALEDENRKPKMIVAEQALGIRVLKDITSRKW